jgi:hypothetical protein
MRDSFIDAFNSYRKQAGLKPLLYTLYKLLEDTAPAQNIDTDEILEAIEVSLKMCSLREYKEDKLLSDLISNGTLRC